MKETAKTTNQVIEFLVRSGHYVWRQNVAGIKNRKVDKNALGSGDIMGILKGGTHIEVEVKTFPDKPRNAQVNHGVEIIDRGGIYLFVRDFDDFLRQWHELVRLLEQMRRSP